MAEPVYFMHDNGEVLLGPGHEWIANVTPNAAYRAHTAPGPVFVFEASELAALLTHAHYSGIEAAKTEMRERLDL